MSQSEAKESVPGYDKYGKWNFSIPREQNTEMRARQKERIQQNKDRFTARQEERDRNEPCLDAIQLAQECINKNRFDSQAVCQTEFLNVRNCKKFWGKVKRRRFWNGESPVLPPPEDRDRVFEQYKHLLK